MTVRRARNLVVLFALVIASACSSSASTSPSSADGATAPVATEPAGSRRPILIDTDVAPDDLVAIAFLLASPDVKIEAITVSGTGEAHCDAGVDVVLRLLERLDAPAIDVACGRETPMAGDLAFPDAWRANVDGGSGLALPATTRQPFAGDAVQLIAETAAEVNGLRVLTLGPLTNLADALGSHPDLVDRVESVYAMGGALGTPNVEYLSGADRATAEDTLLKTLNGSTSP